jgi:hypothetical protein
MMCHPAHLKSSLIRYKANSISTGYYGSKFKFAKSIGLYRSDRNSTGRRITYKSFAIAPHRICSISTGFLYDAPTPQSSISFNHSQWRMSYSSASHAIDSFCFHPISVPFFVCALKPSTQYTSSTFPTFARSIFSH